MIAAQFEGLVRSELLEKVFSKWEKLKWPLSQVGEIWQTSCRVDITWCWNVADKSKHRVDDRKLLPVMYWIGTGLFPLLFLATQMLAGCLSAKMQKKLEVGRTTSPTRETGRSEEHVNAATVMNQKRKSNFLGDQILENPGRDDLIQSTHI